jgi:hypothetical protein
VLDAEKAFLQVEATIDDDENASTDEIGSKM